MFDDERSEHFVFGLQLPARTDTARKQGLEGLENCRDLQTAICDITEGSFQEL